MLSVPYFGPAIAFAVLARSLTATELEIPRSVPGDMGHYYLLEWKRTGDVVRALTKRVGASTIDYSLTETNCKTMRMREIGVSDDGSDKIHGPPTRWFDLVAGSSKSDTAHFLCD